MEKCFAVWFKLLKNQHKKEFSVEIVDPRTLVPLDKDIIINSVKKTGKVVLVNDAHKTSGYIGEISAIISESEAFDYLDAPIRRCAGEMCRCLTRKTQKMQ